MSSNSKKDRPPRFAKWLMESFCSYDFLSTALWDMEELFHRNVKTKGVRKARLLYLKEAISIVIYLFFKGKSQYSTNKIAMFKHNLLISFRSFKRFKSTFFINLFGLASGLACTLLIYLWVSNELSFDKFHEDEGQLYQVMQNMIDNGEIETMSYQPGRLAPTLLDQFPEVEHATMVIPSSFFGDGGFVSFEEKHIRAKEYFVDSSFFDVLTYPLIQGNSDTALDDIGNVIITESFALKLFGTLDNVIGKTVNWNESRTKGDYIISGILKDLPKASSQQFDILLNYELMMKVYPFIAQWYNSNPDAYVRLKKGTSVEAFNLKIKDLIKTYAKNSKSTLFIQKLSDRHLYGSYENGVVAGGRIAYVRLFSLVAGIILIIACINFMNLSTAKASGRLKEIGVKKALGASRKTLIAQYYTESLLLTLMSTLLAVGVARLLLPAFESITGKSLSLNLSAPSLLVLLGIVMITGFLAGSYPALYLSSFKTIASLKGKITHGMGGIWARKGLVIFQFSVSLILIVSVLIISKQMSYIQSKNLGYNRDNVAYFSNNGIDESSYTTFTSKIESVPGVLSSSTSGHNLTGDSGRTSGLDWPGEDPNTRFDFVNLEAGIGFIETLGIELVAGRLFENGRVNETQKIVFNETAIRMMGLEDPIGTVIKLWGEDKEIIGVVRDFHVNSLYDAIEPGFIQIQPMLNSTVIKLQAGTEIQSLNQIEDIYEEYTNGLPFEFQFVDADYQAMYISEKRVASISSYFAIVAVLISCLGLLGLTAFTAERRSKEIGIRKVLGADNWGVIKLLTSDFTKMVMGAIVIGLPISYFIVQNWLQGFAFSIDLEIWYFLFAGSLTLGIAWITVGVQTLKAARTNPVDSLRSE